MENSQKLFTSSAPPTAATKHACHAIAVAVAAAISALQLSNDAHFIRHYRKRELDAGSDAGDSTFLLLCAFADAQVSSQQYRVVQGSKTCGLGPARQRVLRSPRYTNEKPPPTFLPCTHQNGIPSRLSNVSDSIVLWHSPKM